MSLVYFQCDRGVKESLPRLLELPQNAVKLANRWCPWLELLGSDRRLAWTGGPPMPLAVPGN